MRRAAPPAVVAAAFALLGARGPAIVLAAVSLLLLVLGWAAPGLVSALDRALDRFGRVVASGVSTGLSVMAFVLGVLPLWALGRPARRISRTPATGGHSAWTVPVTASTGTAAGSADHAGAAATWPHPTRPWPRVAALATGIVAVVALVLAFADRGQQATSQLAEVPPTVPLVQQPLESIPDDLERWIPAVEPRRARPEPAVEFDGVPVSSYAHEDEPWAAAALGELQQMPYSYDPFLGHRLGEFRGRYVNIVDGRRVSYTPRDPQLDVWFFGGSTMIGIGQRDDHTLPSVVARLAERDGIRIRPFNFGVSGYVNWQSLEQFEQALSSDHLDLPDLVVFYEGVNDSGLGTFRVDLGERDPETVTRLPASDEEREQIRRRNPDVDPLPWSRTRGDLEVELAASQYRRGHDLIDRRAEHYGLRVVTFWQPSPFAKQRNAVDAPLWEQLDFDPEFLPESTERYRRIAELSGVDPIDLTTVLDDVDRPVFFDSSHTNEFGASLIGEAIYRELAPTLRSLVGDP